MSDHGYPSPSSLLQGEKFTEEFNAPALFNANLAKMHHQQSTSQSIRVWSFALTGFFLGSNFLSSQRLAAAIAALVIAETILFLILIREIDWQRMFWRYRDRARVCEAYLLGTVDRDTCRREYMEARDRTRGELARLAFDPVRLLTNSTDFVEVYLMIGLICVFAAHLIWPA